MKTTIGNILKGLLLLSILILATQQVKAQSDAGRTAADFLHIGPSARSAAMGEAYTAVAEGVAGAYWNPAGLTNLNSSEVSFSHFSWYQAITVEYGAIAFKISDKFTTAASIVYMNYGTIQGYDLNGGLTSELNVYDYSASLSFGLKMTEQFSIGLNGKFINQSIDDIKANAFAGDIGLLYEFPRLTISGYLGNLGTAMKFNNSSEKLPAVGRLGFSFYPLSDHLLASLEVEKFFLGNLTFKQGFEVNFEDQYFLRSGYKYFADQSENSLGSSLSFGAGVKFNSVILDYAFSPTDSYSTENLHRFTLTFRLGSQTH